MNPIWGVSVVVVLAWGIGVAVAGEPVRSVERTLGPYTVRYAEGPGERASIGSYAIHVYGHGGADWRAGLVRPRDGGLGHVWLTAAESQAGLRVWVWLQSAGSGRYGKLELLVFDGRTIRHRRLPLPPPSHLRGYMGHDDFFVARGMVYRRFPVYRPGDCNATPSGGMRCLEMRAAGGRWSLSRQAVGF